jgi:lactate permease
VQLGFGGVELVEEPAMAMAGVGHRMERASERAEGRIGAPPGGAGPGRHDVARGMLPFLILVVVVIAWTGPWSPLPKWKAFEPEVTAAGSLGGKTVSASWAFAPAIAGTAILVSWLLIALYLRPNGRQIGQVFRDTFSQMWGALLVGPFIFGLAYVFNFSGMANSMANGFSKVGTVYIVLAPVLGWIAVALSGSNTSSNAVFGQFQYSVAKLLGAPALIFPSLNSVGAEVGKPVAPQTASVGVSTTGFVRNEGEVIRYNMAWTLVILAYLIGIGCLYYFLIPGAMRV